MAAWAAEQDRTGKPSPLKKKNSLFRLRLWWISWDQFMWDLWWTRWD